MESKKRKDRKEKGDKKEEKKEKDDKPKHNPLIDLEEYFKILEQGLKELEEEEQKAEEDETEGSKSAPPELAEPPKKRQRVRPPPLTDLERLIEFAKSHDSEVDYGFDTTSLRSLVDPLERLQSMHAMESVKDAMVKQVLYLLRKFHTKDDFLHAVITGRPGTGKTQVANIIADIYAKLGFLRTNKVRVAKPSEFISQWIGGSSMQAEKIVKEAIGGVLLIDEAYSLGRKDGDKDAFAREILNVINQYASEHRHELVIIIAGYRDALNNYFFNVNPGLERRFPWRYHIEDYGESAMMKIFLSQVKNWGWSLTDEAASYIGEELANGNISTENFGGDTEVLFTKCKVCHAQRTLGDDPANLLDLEDVKGGVKLYLGHKGGEGNAKPKDEAWKSMFL
jgi:SpoVK/Ycf46/Vps4 family AAA+-type ATPase